MSPKAVDFFYKASIVNRGAHVVEEHSFLFEAKPLNITDARVYRGLHCTPEYSPRGNCGSLAKLGDVVEVDDGVGGLQVFDQSPH
ncbi:unnamed protein product [Prunus armeniaca]|uniref:Uncharacterized protein n=1 Tax=Prunus armeniaca TaxID=36596 RepID=A0A6J5TX92_PRUAR|nr:unnamed protein product [Prunus armeniaca]